MLRHLMAAGFIAAGDVDERSITEVTPDDIKGYTQCHFFAGIGGWSFALRAAGWPDTRPVWTGSAPCQPFAAPGQHKGKDDARHLFPCWQRLIAECKPPTVYGEQSPNAVAQGWLDDVYAGLEGEGYAVGASLLPACGVGAPHLRERLWFVAHASVQGGGGSPYGSGAQGGGAGDAPQPHQCGTGGHVGAPALAGHPAYTFWGGGEALPCYDGKERLVKPNIRLLADGVPNRSPILHALGNAIVPQVGTEFIKATMDFRYAQN